MILPACTNFERVDISEWAGLGGYGHHGQQQLNHRVIVFQAPAIAPLGRIAIGLLDLHGNLQTARARQLFQRGHERDRLGQAAVRRLRPAQAHLVEGFHPQGLLRRAVREGEAARAGVVPLVLGEPQEGRAGSAAAAVRLCEGIPARPADPVRQTRIRVQQPEALPRSGAAADREIRAVLGGAAFGRDVYALSAPASHAAFEIQLPHPGRRQGFASSSTSPITASRWTAITIGCCASTPRTRQSAASRSTTWSRSTTTAARSSARRCRPNACARGVCHGYEFFRRLRSDGRARQVGRSRRLPQPADARSARKRNRPIRSPAPIRWSRSSCGTAAIEHMSAAFAEMERDREIKRTLEAASLVPAK